MQGLENAEVNSSEMGRTKKRQQPEGMGKIPNRWQQRPGWFEKIPHFWLQPEGDEKITHLWQFWRNMIFAGSCVISLSVDPFFLYIPVINEVRKCVDLDRTLYIVTVCFRTLLDCISLVTIILSFLRSYLDKDKGTKGDSGVWLRIKRYLKVANDTVAILPIPQVLFLIIFSKMRGSKSLNKRKVLSGVVLLQYLPRALRVYLSCSKVFIHKNIMSINLSKSLIAVKAGFNLFLFIIASHILGGFWYFFSVERETACWHLACESHSDKCVPSSFACNHGSFGNYTFLNDSCPVATPNTTVFDFGIFLGALQSGTVASMDFPRKTLYCFWWGLRNLSSFGSNLQTSSHFWENSFAVLTSISGLVLFMCFLGHLQMYMQWEASMQLEVVKQRELEKAKEELAEEAPKNQLEYKRRWQYEMDAKKGKILEWIGRNPRLKEIEQLIISQVDRMFEENKDIDGENPLPYLPIFTRRDILRRLCLPLLRKVPLLQNESEDVLKLISSDFLEQVYYNENSYIAREGEPLDALLFITQGIVWTYTSTSPDNRQIGFITTDDFYGVELLEWVFKSPFLPDPSNLPFSTRTLRCQTKVEGFALTVSNIQHMLYKYSWKFSKFRGMRDYNLVQSFPASNGQKACLG